MGENQEGMDSTRGSYQGKAELETIIIIVIERDGKIQKIMV